jgi:DNA-binding LytR/AlgR family response regulator
MNAPIKIVVIHDGLIPKVDPLLVTLQSKFGEKNVIHLENSNEGLDYIMNNINQKTIVVLDINFSKGELSGLEVFKSIREKTSLIYVILITADEIIKLKNDDLVFLINNDAFALESVTADYTRIVSLVESATHKLDARVDAVLEDWIIKQPNVKREKPYITTKDGKTYTLDNILESIRQQTEIGKHMERNILKLAVDLLTRHKTKLND